MTGAALGWLPWCRAGIDVSSDRCLPIARALTSSFKVLLSGEARNGYQASSVGLLRLQKLFELLEQGKIARGIFLCISRNTARARSSVSLLGSV